MGHVDIKHFSLEIQIKYKGQNEDNLRGVITDLLYFYFKL